MTSGARTRARLRTSTILSALARILIVEGGLADAATIAAALLHDTIEDTETSPQELEFEFGREICAIVEEVTDDKALPKADRKRPQVEHRGAGQPQGTAREARRQDRELARRRFVAAGPLGRGAAPGILRLGQAGDRPAGWALWPREAIFDDAYAARPS